MLSTHENSEAKVIPAITLQRRVIIEFLPLLLMFHLDLYIMLLEHINPSKTLLRFQ